MKAVGQPLLTLAVAGVAYAALFASGVAYVLYVALRRPEGAPPKPPADPNYDPLKRQPCAETADAYLAFDPDLYDCPCGHAYGEHDYDLPVERPRRMVIRHCLGCEAARGRP